MNGNLQSSGFVNNNVGKCVLLKFYDVNHKLISLKFYKVLLIYFLVNINTK